MIPKSQEKAAMLAASALMALVMVASPLPARAEPTIDPDAAKVLSQMQAYLGGLKSFTVKYDSDFDILTPLGEKLKLLSSGDIAVHRPGQMRITRKGALSDVSLILDGKQLTLLGKKRNAYLQAPATTIDDAIAIVRDEIGFPAPGADILATLPFDLDTADVVSGKHVGMSMIGGQMVHHLAFRGSQIDWQLWVKDGPEPLPLRYVVTSKWTTGAPEYSLTLSDWNVSPVEDPAAFTFTPPAGAQEITGVVVDDAGEITGITE